MRFQANNSNKMEFGENLIFALQNVDTDKIDGLKLLCVDGCKYCVNSENP